MSRLSNLRRNIFFVVLGWIAFGLINRTELGHEVLASRWFLVMLLLAGVALFIRLLNEVRSAVKTLRKPDISAEELTVVKQKQQKTNGEA